MPGDGLETLKTLSLCLPPLGLGDIAFAMVVGPSVCPSVCLSVFLSHNHELSGAVVSRLDFCAGGLSDPGWG